jgi:septum formation topological specificity factor MinE
MENSKLKKELKELVAKYDKLQKDTNSIDTAGNQNMTIVSLFLDFKDAVRKLIAD